MQKILKMSLVDIDIAYRLDYNKFSQKYVDGFQNF